jgi:hypothetical protein
MGYYDALVALWPTLTGSVQEKLDAANRATVAGPDRGVPIAEVMTYLRSNNLWLPIKQAAAAGSSVGAAAAVDLNADMRINTIDFNLPIVGGMLADMVGHKLLTQAQSDALVAMKAATILWRDAHGYPELSLNDVAAAGLV